MRGSQQPAEVGVSRSRLDQERHMGAAISRSGAGKAGTSALGRLRRAYAAERDLGAGDRADAEGLRRVRELERAADAVVVGERERLVTELGRAHDQFLRQRGAV